MSASRLPSGAFWLRYSICLPWIWGTVSGAYCFASRSASSNRPSCSYAEIAMSGFLACKNNASAVLKSFCATAFLAKQQQEKEQCELLRETTCGCGGARTEIHTFTSQHIRDGRWILCFSNAHRISPFLQTSIHVDGFTRLVCMQKLFFSFRIILRILQLDSPLIVDLIKRNRQQETNRKSRSNKIKHEWRSTHQEVGLSSSCQQSRELQQRWNVQDSNQWQDLQGSVWSAFWQRSHCRDVLRTDEEFAWRAQAQHSWQHEVHHPNCRFLYTWPQQFANLSPWGSVLLQVWTATRSHSAAQSQDEFQGDDLVGTSQQWQALYQEAEPSDTFEQLFHIHWLWKTEKEKRKGLKRMKMHHCPTRAVTLP